MTHVSVDGMVGIAAGNGFQAPGPADFEFPDIFNGNQVLLAKSSLLLVLGAIVVAAFFLITTRRLRIVPSKPQYFSEEAYSFVRNGIAQDIIGGRDYMRFVPLLTTMFFFILVNNLFGLVPFLQFAPFSRAGFAYALAGMVWVVYNGVGIARHGFFPYLKLQTVPPGVPAWILPLLVPLEFLSNLIIRPITLSLRLFANMFAGHLLIVMFSVATWYLLSPSIGALYGTTSFVVTLGLTAFELLVQFLQAYIFVTLASSYIAGALEEAH